MHALLPTARSLPIHLMWWWLVQSQPALAGRNVEDLSEDELLSLIASKRRLAQIALSGVVDSDESSK